MAGYVKLKGAFQLMVCLGWCFQRHRQPR